MFLPKYDIMPISVKNNQISPNMVHATNMNATQYTLSIFKTTGPLDQDIRRDASLPSYVQYLGSLWYIQCAEVHLSHLDMRKDTEELTGAGAVLKF